MPWPTHDTFWEDKKKKEPSVRQVWVNIEYFLSRKDSLRSFSSSEVPDARTLSPQNTLKSFQTNDHHYIDATPVRRNVMGASKIEGNCFTQLQVPLLPPLDHTRKNNRDSMENSIFVSPKSFSSSTSSKRRLSVGSESDQYSDHVEDDSFSLVDDDSLASLQHHPQDVYEKMWLSISPMGGYLSFHLVQANHDDTTQVESATKESCTDPPPPTNPSSPPLDNKTTSSLFELTSTNAQSQKDQMNRLQFEIRRACLKVAAESYKNSKMDVPDVRI